MITITDRAKKYIVDALEVQKAAGVLISVIKGGCSGLTYKFDFVGEDFVNEGCSREVVECAGAKVFIDPSALLFIIGTQLDYIETGVSSKLVFRNPNAKHQCGCGKSFQV